MVSVHVPKINIHYQDTTDCHPKMFFGIFPAKVLVMLLEIMRDRATIGLVNIDPGHWKKTTW